MAVQKELTFHKDELCVAQRPNHRRIGFMANGQLILDGRSYAAVSGPWNKGVMPNGKYTIKKYNVVASTKEAGYRSPSGKGWFIPLEQPANLDRSGFGIHPDGNVPGTAGCVGLVGVDADKFWQAWVALPMEERPAILEVTGATEAGKGTCTISGSAAKE